MSEDILGVDYSNQEGNIVAGDPNPAPGKTTEEQIAHIRGKWAKFEITRYGIKVVDTHICGNLADGGGTVDELVEALNKLYAVPGLRWVMSLHSDASGPQDAYGLCCRNEDVPWTLASANYLADSIGFARQGRATNRVADLAVASRAYKHLPPKSFILYEIGEHGVVNSVYGMPSDDALWLYAAFHGIMAARAFLKAIGKAPAAFLPIPAEVAVPKGYEHLKVAPVVVPPVVPPVTPPAPATIPAPSTGKLIPVYALGSRVLLDDRNSLTPYMTGSDVLKVQEFLNAHYPAGTGFAKPDGSTSVFPLALDGAYGPCTAGGDGKFQNDHYSVITGAHLKVDFTVNAETLQKMKSVGLK